MCQLIHTTPGRCAAHVDVLLLPACRRILIGGDFSSRAGRRRIFPDSDPLTSSGAERAAIRSTVSGDLSCGRHAASSRPRIRSTRPSEPPAESVVNDGAQRMVTAELLVPRSAARHSAGEDHRSSLIVRDKFQITTPVQQRPCQRSDIDVAASCAATFGICRSPRSRFRQRPGGSIKMFSDRISLPGQPAENR